MDSILIKHKLEIYRTCPICGKRSTIKTNATSEQYTKYRIGSPIQAVFPDMPKEKRETIRSGICSECQKDLF